jgi:hypothetical protein
VNLKEGHGGLVPHALSERGRADDVGEQDGPDSRVPLTARTSRDDRGTRRVGIHSPEESLRYFGGDLDDPLGDQAVGFTVHRLRCLGTGCAAEAEDLPEALVEPVLVVLDTVFALHFHIGNVCLGHVVRGGPVDFVDIHVHRHVGLPAVSA